MFAKTLNTNSFISESQERVENIKLSVEKAKEAVSLDVSDGVSWCKYNTPRPLHVAFRKNL